MPTLDTLKIEPKTYQSGKLYYRLIGTIGGKRIRKNFPLPELAERERLRLQKDAFPEAVRNLQTTILTSAQLRDAEAAITRLNLSKVTESLSSIVESWLKTYTPYSEMEWEAAVDLFGNWREKVREVKPDTVVTDTYRLNRLAADAGITCLKDLDPERLRKALYDPRRTNRTQRDYRDSLHNFFEWMVNEKYLPHNIIKSWERPKVKREEIQILTHTQVRDLLNQSGDMLGYFAICLFSGVRPDEAKRLRWEDVDLTPDHSGIWVKWGRTKTRAGKVSIPDNLRTILCYCQDRNYPLPAPYNRPQFDTARKLAGVLSPSIWVNDVCRHTYASNMYDLWSKQGKTHQEVIGKLLREMRTSETMLWDSYITQLLQDDSQQYLGIVPECLSI